MPEGDHDTLLRTGVGSRQKKRRIWSRSRIKNQHAELFGGELEKANIYLFLLLKLQEIKKKM